MAPVPINIYLRLLMAYVRNKVGQKCPRCGRQMLHADYEVDSCKMVFVCKNCNKQIKFTHQEIQDKIDDLKQGIEVLDKNPELNRRGKKWRLFPSLKRWFKNELEKRALV